MIFDPSHGERKAPTKSVEAGAKAEVAQGKQIAHKGNETYAAETAALHQEAKTTLLSMGRELLGYARELHDKSILLSALMAAIDVGAYKGVARDLERDLTSGSLEGVEATTFQTTPSRLDVADMLSKLLEGCDTVTSSAQRYARRYLELSEGDKESGLGSAKTKAVEYIKQNLGRTIEEVETGTRWVIDNFEQIMRELSTQLDGLVDFLEKINANEHEFTLQLLRCEPSRDWNVTSELGEADQNARNQLLQASQALRSTIENGDLSSLVSRVTKSRDALLADARE